jgi:uncharacterized phiE125 gp8 family phage protein
MSIVNVTTPIETIVSLADAKAHLKVDYTDDDALITALIAVAVDWVESQIQKRLAVRQVDWTTDNLSNGMRLPLAPVVSVDALTYLTYPYGPAVVMPTANYIVAPDGQATIICKPYNLLWPWIGQGPNPVVVRFTVGGVALVSPVVLHAVKIVIANLYEYRGTAMYGRETPSVMDLTGGTLSAIDALLYAERWQ